MKRKSEREADALVAAGQALLAAGDLPAAIGQFQRAVERDSNFMPAQFALGCAWLDAGEAIRALEILSGLGVSGSPLAAVAAAKIADAEAMVRAQRSAAPYVRHLFDQFSQDYDRQMLGALSYRAHVVLRGLADMLMVPQPGSLDVLDVGCGTGLAGECFKDLARRLDGLDLSPGMIERARARGIYDFLAIADVESLAASEGPFYDLVIAADILVYLGDLRPVFRGVAGRLRRGGFFLFTVEKREGAGYELGPKRRYRHSDSYVREQAADAGLEVMGLVECAPREEAKIPVPGLAAALQRN